MLYNQPQHGSNLIQKMETVLLYIIFDFSHSLREIEQGNRSRSSFSPFDVFFLFIAILSITPLLPQHRRVCYPTHFLHSLFILLFLHDTPGWSGPTRNYFREYSGPTLPSIHGFVSNVASLAIDYNNNFAFTISTS